MDYKEKYEMALEGIQEILSSGEDSIKMSRLQLRLQGIFPELKVSEDEKIRKWIIRTLKLLNNSSIQIDGAYEMMLPAIAWLEKQCNNINCIYDKELSELLHIVICRYVNDPDISYIERENVSKKIFPYVELLEKQGEQKFMPQEYADAFDEFMSHIPEKEPEFSESCYNYDDMVSAIQFGIKWQQQHDSIVKVKPKYEPKFHKGDWVIGRATENEPRQIAEITEDGYKSTYGGWYGFSFEEDMHLWTIKDAKDGDVLFQDLMGGKTFIYNGVNPDMAILYSFIISNDGEDVLPYHIGKPNTGIGNIEENKNIIHPATKEQRDLLFQKMHKAGYEWDAEKKELKKIEQKSAWSEEDENLFRCAMDAVEQESKVRTDGCLDEEVGKMVTDWLKFLKSRVQPQPKQEWGDEDETYSDHVITAIKSYYTDDLGEENPWREKLLRWLKSLRPQSTWKLSEK